MDNLKVNRRAGKFSGGRTTRNYPAAKKLPMTRSHHRPLKLAAWRKYRNKTQDQVAQAVGISKVHVSNIENGKRQYTQELLEAFADYLQCEPWHLIEVDPIVPDSLWSIWEALKAAPVERRGEIAEIIRVVGKRKTG